MKLIMMILFALIFIPGIAKSEVELADGIKYVDPEIKKYLEKRAAEDDELKKAIPYVSNVLRGDINGDKKADVLVSYAIEGIGGGNFSLFYQALFINEKGKLIFKAERSNGSFGTAQGKTYIPLRMEKGKVVCKTLAYAPDDGVCCPSIKGKGEILYRNGKLIEKKPNK